MHSSKAQNGACLAHVYTSAASFALLETFWNKSVPKREVPSTASFFLSATENLAVSSIREGGVLKISIEETPGSLRLTLEGRLVGPWVAEVQRVCVERNAPNEKFPLTVDLCGLTSMDAAGQLLLQNLFRRGATLRCSDVLNQYLVEQMAETKKAAQAACRPCQSKEAENTLVNGRS
jgi:hypothetical protein